MDQSVQQSDQAALDLESLKERCMGNLALVERVLAKFTGQLENDLDALEQAIETNNADQAVRLTHRIKGTAGSVSARHLYVNASLAEQRAQDKQVAELTSDLARMRIDRLELVETIERIKLGA